MRSSNISGGRGGTTPTSSTAPSSKRFSTLLNTSKFGDQVFLNLDAKTFPTAQDVLDLIDCIHWNATLSPLLNTIRSKSALSTAINRRKTCTLILAHGNAVQEPCQNCVVASLKLEDHDEVCCVKADSSISGSTTSKCARCIMSGKTCSPPLPIISDSTINPTSALPRKPIKPRSKTAKSPTPLAPIDTPGPLYRTTFTSHLDFAKRVLAPFIIDEKKDKVWSKKNKKGVQVLRIKVVLGQMNRIKRGGKGMVVDQGEEVDDEEEGSRDEEGDKEDAEDTDGEGDDSPAEGNQDETKEHEESDEDEDDEDETETDKDEDEDEDVIQYVRPKRTKMVKEQDGEDDEDDDDRTQVSGTQAAEEQGAEDEGDEEEDGNADEDDDEDVEGAEHGHVSRQSGRRVRADDDENDVVMKEGDEQSGEHTGDDRDGVGGGDAYGQGGMDIEMDDQESETDNEPTGGEPGENYDDRDMNGKRKFQHDDNNDDDDDNDDDEDSIEIHRGLGAPISDHGHRKGFFSLDDLKDDNDAMHIDSDDNDRSFEAMDEDQLVLTDDGDANSPLYRARQNTSDDSDDEEYVVLTDEQIWNRYPSLVRR